jgi:hypothetical protein
MERRVNHLCSHVKVVDRVLLIEQTVLPERRIMWQSR